MKGIPAAATLCGLLDFLAVPEIPLRGLPQRHALEASLLLLGRSYSNLRGAGSALLAVTLKITNYI